MALTFRLAASGFDPTTMDALDELITSIGGDCVASGPTAAALHGFHGFVLRPPFDVTIGRGRFVSRVGHRVHTTIELGPLDRAELCGLPVLSPTRTIIDLAATQPPGRLERAIDSALESGGTSEDFLFRRIGALRSRGRYGLPALLDVLVGKELTRGGTTWLEREVLRLLHRHGLPRPHTQVVLARRGAKDVRVDFRFPGTPVVLEALGYHFHRTARQMQVDAERMNELQLSGHLALQCTYRDVVAGMAPTIAALRRALGGSVSAHRWDDASMC